MTDIYPLPPPFSDDEILKPLRPQSDAAPAKRWNAAAAGVAAASVLVGLGVGGFVLVGSDPASRDGTTARIEAPAPAPSVALREPAVPEVAARGASVAEPSTTASVRPSAESAAPPPVAVAPPSPTPAPSAATASPPAAAPVPAPEAQPPQPSAPARSEPLRRLASEEIRLHLERGEALLAQGDLAAARLFFERVAEAGDARGAFGLARSYDPAVLSRLPVHGVAGNVAEVERWRRVAASMAPAFAERR
jgi:hypothetical protein